MHSSLHIRPFNTCKSIFISIQYLQDPYLYPLHSSPIFIQIHSSPIYIHSIQVPIHSRSSISFIPYPSMEILDYLKQLIKTLASLRLLAVLLTANFQDNIFCFEKRFMFTN